MAFGSLQPTKVTKTTLQSNWDCSQSPHAVRKLVNSWLEGDKSSTLAKNTRLSLTDQQMVQSIVAMDQHSITKQLIKTFQYDLSQFEKVRTQLLSLLLAWEQIILEKKRYDEEGFDMDGSDFLTITPPQFLILFRIISSHSQVGLLSLRKTGQSSCLETGIKRSIESPEPGPAAKSEEAESTVKRIKFNEEDGNKTSDDKKTEEPESVPAIKDA